MNDWEWEEELNEVMKLWPKMVILDFFLIFIYLFIYLYFGYVGSSLLHVGFL